MVQTIVLHVLRTFKVLGAFGDSIFIKHIRLFFNLHSECPLDDNIRRNVFVILGVYGVIDLNMIL